MRTIISILIAVILLSCSSKYKNSVNEPGDYNIIPKPQKMTLSDGRFLVTSSTDISADESLSNESAYLAEMLFLATGHVMKTDVSGGSAKIQLKIDANIDNEEGYKLSVTYNKIVISGKTP